MGDVPDEFARLELRRDELSVCAFDELHPEKPVLHLDGIVLGRSKPVCLLAPEVCAVAPLGIIKPAAIEFIMPDKVELHSPMQKRRFASRHRCDALADKRECVKIVDCLQLFRDRAEARASHENCSA